MLMTATGDCTLRSAVLMPLLLCYGLLTWFFLDDFDEYSPVAFFWSKMV